jgi:hypothetical protein
MALFDKVKKLAEDYGFRLDHHNLGQLMDALRGRHLEEWEWLNRQFLGYGDRITRSIFIGPFLELVEREGQYIKPPEPETSE